MPSDQGQCATEPVAWTGTAAPLRANLVTGRDGYNDDDGLEALGLPRGNGVLAQGTKRGEICNAPGGNVMLTLIGDLPGPLEDFLDRQAQLARQAASAGQNVEHGMGLSANGFFRNIGGDMRLHERHASPGYENAGKQHRENLN